ncbi:MAG: murein hydrolase activator EnvC family protein, partial [Actinomycetota bacterium]
MRARITLACALVAAAAAAGLPSHAARSDRVERTRREIRSRQEDALMSLLRQADDRHRAIEDSIARIERRIEDVRRSRDALKPRLEAAEFARQNAASGVLTAEAAFQQSRKSLGANALSLYATGHMGDAFRLIGTRDLADYVSANVYIDSVLHSNSRLVDDFHRARDRLRAEHQRVEQETKTIVEKSRALQEEEARLTELAESRQRVASELTAATVARAEAISAITGDPAGFDSVLRSYQNATGAIRLLVAAAQQGQPVEPPEAGSLWQPIEGRISSGYGWRRHPIYGYRSNHTGIDIAADYGTKIRASRAGIVVDVVY